jgi:hypothetical protein
MQYSCNGVIILKNSWLFQKQLNLLLPAIYSVGSYSGSVNVKQLEAVDMHTESITSNTHSSSNVETKGRSFLTNQTRVTGVQDVITRMKNADQGGTTLMIYDILILS